MEIRGTGLGRVLTDIRAERARQDRKWGPSISRPTPSLAVLIEEVGEVAQAMLDSDYINLREELIQVSAVSVAMVEGMDRGDVPGG